MKRYMKKKKKLSRVITLRLFIAVFIAFIVSSVLSYALMYYYCDFQAKELMRYNSLSMAVDLEENMKAAMFEGTARFIIDDYYKNGEEGAMEALKGGNYTYFAKRDGTILLSGNESFIGQNIRDIEYIAGIMDEMIQFFDEGGGSVYQMAPALVKTLDGKAELYYMLAGDPEYPDAFFAMAWTKEMFESLAETAALSASINHTVGMTGNHIVIGRDNNMITNYSEMLGEPFPYMYILEKFENASGDSIEDVPISISLQGGQIVTIESKRMIGKDTLWDEDVYYCLTKVFGIYDLIVYPLSEAMTQANDTIVMLIIFEVMIFAVLFIVLRLLIKRRVVKNLAIVNASLNEITNGNLDEKVEVRDTREFDSLSSDINATVEKLKEYIAEAAARIDADLAVAKAIQSSALPSVFPPFPDRKEFELFASMNAAKEVGGDFYDFYMLNDRTLGILIADVSGKSIPGAMFMMTAKTVIKSLAESGLTVQEVFTEANEKLCEGNEAEMFVTAWLGYIDLQTGLVRVANAGHNPPILIHDGKAEYLKFSPGLMLAGMEGIRYKEQTLQLQKGDMLYLYTDGVTEAMNKEEELYGEERLKELLSFGENCPSPSSENGIVEPVCEMVIRDLENYTNGAEQSDDITMLCLRFWGS